MTLLTEFLLRLSFGMAAGMAIVPPRLVTSGYYRNHLYVTLGLSALAALLSRVAAPAAFWWALATAVLSYVGSVCWLYEKRGAGVAALVAVAVAAVIGALAITQFGADMDQTAAATRAASPELADTLRLFQPITSGLLLGTTMAAMLLGHWYLNAPGMELAPLRRLLIAMAGAVALQATLCGVGLALNAAHHDLTTQEWIFISLRWSFGLLGLPVLIWMVWKTLEIPNTQSATGILYVAAICVLAGETVSLPLSAESVFPV
ncbi:MAG: hypothetical protein JNL18_12900 [Planctomycetaceae bacterium]|nr:hypothetical protein [Planctomycetaceae bacterium]